MKFIKMEALGNDYIYVDMEENPSYGPDSIKELAPRLCPRNTGVGPDGIIILYREHGHIFTRIFNPDSSEAEVCGNGLRCVARIAFDKGWTSGKKSFDIVLGKTKKHIKAQVNEDLVSVNLGKAEISEADTIFYKENEIHYMPVNMGNPHAVIFVSDLDSVKVEELGSAVENDKKFPQRTNVEFAEVISKTRIRLRIWERGAGETLACGSGACATAYAAFYSGFCEENVEIEMKGGLAQVSIKEDRSMLLTGPVNYVFKGELAL